MTCARRVAAMACTRRSDGVPLLRHRRGRQDAAAAPSDRTSASSIVSEGRFSCTASSKASILSATTQSATAALAMDAGASPSKAASRCAAASTSAFATAASRRAVASVSYEATRWRGPSSSISSRSRCASSRRVSASAISFLYCSTYSARLASPFNRSASAAAAAAAAASAAAAQVSSHVPSASSFPSQQSQTPSPTRDAGTPEPSAHAKRFRAVTPEHAEVRGSSAPSAQSQ
mmetsp:Transcript_4975/g.11834  ORF Transcript_4975/g.11834 Transcript_4975/m.11834 type:complete len:233 (-) Transcript_4975:304-1002(-)